MKSKTNSGGGDGRRSLAATAVSSSKTREATRAHRLAPQHILVPVDFSEASLGALEYAATFADSFGAKLVLLHVIEPVVVPDPMSGGLPENGEMLVEVGKEKLELLRARRVRSGRAETLVRIGHAHSEIIDTANALGVDLIILPARANIELSELGLGSTVEKVARQAACAVLLVRHAGSS